MKLTKSNEIITRKELSDKIFRALAEINNACPDNDTDTLNDLKNGVENLLAFHSSNAQKWVNLRLNEYVPLSEFKNHCRKDNFGGTELDNGVVDIDLDF